MWKYLNTHWKGTYIHQGRELWLPKDRQRNARSYKGTCEAQECVTVLLLGQCGCISFGGKIWVLPSKISGTMIYTYQIYCQFTTFFKKYMFIDQLCSSPWTEIQLNPYCFLSKQLEKLLVQATVPNSGHEERTVLETPSGAACTNCDRPALFVTLEWVSAISQGTLCPV